MNENEKLLNAEAENEKSPSAPEKQITNDSQQNIDSMEDESPAEPQKKAARSRKKTSTDKGEEKSPAPEAEEKPKPRRKSAAKTADALPESPTEKLADSKSAEAEISVQAFEKVTDAEKAESESSETADTSEEELTKASFDETVTEEADAEEVVTEEADAEEVVTEEASEEKTSDADYFEPALVISSEQFAWDLDDTSDSSDTKFVGERIIPPDELFADRDCPDEEAEALPDTLLEETEEISAEEYTEYDDDENLDDDGQYTLGELELQSETEEKTFTDEAMQKYDPKNPRKIDGRFDLVELFVFTLLAVMIVTTFFFRHAVVDGASMENTLHGGEHLIISDFFYTPERGDIIVCEDYTTDLAKPIVKRVIAVGGDHILIKPNGEVYVNGERQYEDYVFIDGLTPMYSVDMIVDEGELFVMGDHRNVSLDSRAVGTISVDSVLGKVLLRFYPFSKFGTVN